MKLYITLTFRCDDKNFLLFIQKVIQTDCTIQSINYISSEHTYKIYKAELVYTDRRLFKEKILQWITKECTLIECSDIMNQGIDGGLLKVSSKIPFETPDEFEGKVLGYFELIKDNTITKDTYRYTGISKNIGMIILNEEKNELQPDEIYNYLLIERDSLIISHCNNYNPQPLLLKYKSKEDIIKTLYSVSGNYALMRVAIMNNIEDISLFHQMSEVTPPIINREFDEIPLYITVKIMNLLKLHNIKLSDSVVGFIGVTTSLLRCTRLLNSIGCSKVLGFDPNEKNLYYFEKESGIATSTDNVFENADILLFVSDICENIDYYKLQKGQLVLSNPAIHFDMLISEERGVKANEYLNIENSYLLLPGIIDMMLMNDIKTLNDNCLINIARALVKANIDIDNTENIYTIKDIIKNIQ